MKSFYRERLRNFKKYIKISILAKEVGIPSNLLSMFMKSPAYDYCLSLAKLEKLDAYIVDILEGYIL